MHLDFNTLARMISMGLVTAFGMPGILELGIIAVLVLPVIIAIVFFVLLSQKPKT